MVKGTQTCRPFYESPCQSCRKASGSKNPKQEKKGGKRKMKDGKKDSIFLSLFLSFLFWDWENKGNIRKRETRLDFHIFFQLSLALSFHLCWWKELQNLARSNYKFDEFLWRWGSSKNYKARARSTGCTLNISRTVDEVQGVYWILQGPCTKYGCILNITRPVHEVQGVHWILQGPCSKYRVYLEYYKAHARSTGCTLNITRPVHEVQGVHWILQDPCTQ